MGNMSYCRFQNTLTDLRDCQDDLNQGQNLEHLDGDELKAARRLIKVCRDIADDWGDEIE